MMFDKQSNGRRIEVETKWNRTCNRRISLYSSTAEGMTLALSWFRPCDPGVLTVFFEDYTCGVSRPANHVRVGVILSRQSN